MNTLNDLNITNVDYDLSSGFFWVQFEGGKSLQCCLNERKDGKGYKKEISLKNSGFNEGLSADNNEWAADIDQWEHVNGFLINQAKKAGLRIA